jgi:predicted phosphodiesterase
MKLGILTDIHEDITTLKLAIKTLEKKGCNEIACLGDITGYELPFYSYRTTRNAHECLAAVKANCSTIVIGNHDLFALREIPNHQAGFNFPRQWYDLDYDERVILAANKVWLYEANSLSSLLGRADKEFLASLPEFAVMEIAQHRVLFSHSLFPDPTGSMIWGPEDSWNFNKHFQVMKQYKCDVGFSGHFHPNGVVKATGANFSNQSFGKFNIKESPVHFICPCIAHCVQFSGVTIFDASKNEVESIQLKIKNNKQSVQHEKD